MITSDKMKVGPWVAKKVFGKFHPEDSEAIGLEKEGELIAGVIYENWNGRSIVCHIAVDGKMTPSYLGAIFHYPFEFCGVDKIIAPIAESNTECMNLVRNMGFELEAELSEAHPDGSLFLFTMRKENCRFIGDKYGKRFTFPAARA